MITIEQKKDLLKFFVITPRENNLWDVSYRRSNQPSFYYLWTTDNDTLINIVLNADNISFNIFRQHVINLRWNTMHLGRKISINK